MQIRAISWNLFHGRDAPPDPALFTWRSRLLRRVERNETHLQLNRELVDEFAALLAGARWDIALLQECPPRWVGALAGASEAEAHFALTSRNSLAALRSAIARANPDLLASAEGGCNLTLVRGSLASEAGPAITERRFCVIHSGSPERRVMVFSALRAGICVANLHATNDRPRLASGDVLHAARRAADWSQGRPLIFGGDLNLRPGEQIDLFAELRDRHGLSEGSPPEAIDHLLARGLGVLSPPSAWPAERRELRREGLALRLSDHAPVEAVFELDRADPEIRRSAGAGGGPGSEIVPGTGR